MSSSISENEKRFPEKYLSYTYEEDVSILQYIIQNKKLTEIKDSRLWKEISERGIVERPWQALRTHFIDNIITSLHKFRLSENSKEQLLIYSGYVYEPPGGGNEEPSKKLKKIPKEYLAPEPFFWMDTKYKKTKIVKPSTTKRTVSFPNRLNDTFKKQSIESENLRTSTPIHKRSTQDWNLNQYFPEIVEMEENSTSK